MTGTDRLQNKFRDHALCDGLHALHGYTDKTRKHCLLIMEAGSTDSL